MDLQEVFSAKAVALNQTESGDNKIAYLGLAFFPNDKKMGLDLKWIKTHNGLPISLAPSNFNAKSQIRTRKGFEFDKKQMAFFRESMQIDEEDMQEIQRVQESSDPYAQAVLNHIYSDSDRLIEGARVVPERMRMQLLFPESAGPAIYISHDGVTYSYNYDADGTWVSNNRIDLSGTSLWANASTAKPLTDIRTITRKAKKAGSVIKYMVMNQATFDLMLGLEQVKSAILAQNVTANIFMDDDMLKQFIATKFKLEVLVYDKSVKDTDETNIQLVPDGFIAFVPDGPLGKTWFGTTPEERTLMGKSDVDVAIIDNGIAIAVVTHPGPPVETLTTASEIVLPSYERMDEVFLLGVGTASEENAELDFLTVTVSEGTATGTTAFSVAETLASGHVYKVKVGTTLPNYGQNLQTWSPYTEGSDYVATNGSEIVIAEVDSTYKAVGAAVVVADSKA